MRIRVIGLGFAGAASALLFARAGHQVDLFEKTAQPGAVGAGILLQPSGQAVLQELGLMDEILPGCHRIQALQARNQHGRQFMNLSLDSFPTYGVRRGEVFAALHRAVRESRVRVHLGHVATPGEMQEDGYDLTIVADGSRSSLREALFNTQWRQDYEMGALWFCSPVDGPSPNLHQVSQGTRRLCGFLPTRPGCSFFWSCTPQEFAGYQRDNFTSLRQEATRLAPEGTEVIDSLDPTSVLFASYRHAWVPRWQRGKIVLIGDAAHPMSPHLGQGVNMALLDACCLARSWPDLSRYCRVRQNHLRLYSTLSYLLTPFFQSNPDLGRSLGRDLALPLMLRWPWLADQMRQAVYGLKGGWFTGCKQLSDLT